MRVLAVTPAARAWLAGTGPARVLNVFERAANLVDEAGAVLSLVAAGRGLAPFSALVAAGADFPALTAASAVCREPGVVRVGPLAFEWAAAETWDPRPEWGRLGPALTVETLSALAEFAPRAAPAGSLLVLPQPGPKPAWLERAAAGAAELIGGLIAEDVARSVVGARLLAGLGGGLTPAGDDFIVGALLARWAAGAENALSEAVAQAAAPLTTTLSAAYLRAAARGECSAYWHALLAAVAGGADWRPAARELLAVGHTSGADALAGFLSVLLAAGGGGRRIRRNPPD